MLERETCPEQKVFPHITVGGLAALVAAWFLATSALLSCTPFSLHSESMPASPTTSTSQKWHLLLRQGAPDCSNSPGIVWYVHTGGTLLSCTKSGLVMRQKSRYYAEVDLVQVNGNTYKQMTFRVQVQATFQNPHDTTTSAAVLVQTPAAVSAVGGYILVLSPTGQWQLQDVATATNIPIVRNGSVNINPMQPVTMLVEVRDKMLYGFINGLQVVSYADSLNPTPGQVGLLVEGVPAIVAPSVLYSNFELDM